MYKPSDKLVARGVEALSDAELLTLLLNDDAAGADLACRALDSYGGSLLRLLSEDLSRLRMVEGMGLKRAERLVVAAEVGRRCAVEMSQERVVVSTSSDVVSMFRPMLESLRHEECWVLYLNASNRVLEQRRVSQGGVTATIVDPRIVTKRAIELLATQIVLVHNHPSGSVDPSPDDVELTKRLKSALQLFNIHLLDHIIIASTGEFSLLSAGLL